MDYPYFAQNLKALRLIHHLSRSDLANMVGFSNGSILNWETGRVTPRRSSLLRLSFFFGEALEDILYEEKNYVTELDKRMGKSVTVT